MSEENQAQTTEKTYTQADFEALTAKHQEEMNALAGKLRAEFKDKEAKTKAEAEKQARQAQMSELEKAQSEANDWKAKYDEAQSTIDLSNQKEETRKEMAEVGVNEKYLKYVFVPKDMEATKANIKSLKADIEEIKKSTFEKNVRSEIPGAGNENNVQIAAMRKVAGLK